MKINLMPLFFKRNKQQSRNPVNAFMLLCLLLISLVSCDNKTRQFPEPVDLIWNFNDGYDGWIGGFAEYPMGGEAQYELLFEHDTLPLPLDQEQRSLKLSGKNVDGNLFMFVKKKIDGLDPNAVYFVTFIVEFASNLPGDSTIQNSPGNLVHMAAGAANIEPHKINAENNMYGMNIGKSNLDQNGEHMTVLGDFTNGSDQPVYVLKNLENENPFRCITDENGEMWIVIGIDSAYPDNNTFYLNSITVELF